MKHVLALISFACLLPALVGCGSTPDKPAEEPATIDAAMVEDAAKPEVRFYVIGDR